MRGRAEVWRQRQRLLGAYQRINQIDPLALELRSDFARYLCVATSGFLEQAVQELAMECCRRLSSGAALNFALAELDHTRNPTIDHLLHFVGAFHSEWREELDGFLTPERRAAVGSLVGLRTALSHGEPASVTYSQVDEYCRRMLEVVDFLADKFDPVA